MMWALNPDINNSKPKNLISELRGCTIAYYSSSTNLPFCYKICGAQYVTFRGLDLVSDLTFSLDLGPNIYDLRVLNPVP